MTNANIIKSIVCVLAADNDINQQEHQFLKNLSRQLNVSPKMIDAAIAVVKNGRGKIQWSPQPTEKLQLFDLLVQAAAADQVMAPKEREMLHSVAAKMELAQSEVERIIARHFQPSSAARHQQPVLSEMPDREETAEKRQVMREIDARMAHERKIKLIAFLICFSLGLIWGLWSFMAQLSLWQNTKYGVRVPAMLQSVEFKGGRKGRGGSVSSVWIDAKYTYTYKNRAYTGSKVFIVPTKINSDIVRDEHQRLQDALAKQQPVWCYVNDASPEIVVLHTEFFWGDAILALITRVLAGCLLAFIPLKIIAKRFEQLT